MNEQKLSKFLSLILRHQPETIGLVLDANGWANVNELLTKANVYGQTFSHKQLIDVVKNNDKQRFSFSADGLYIRVNQGHSIAIDLALIPKQPPEFLYHGTATRFLPNILTVGLIAKSRQYVHLSHDKTTAITVGKRHGKPVGLKVASNAMQQQGYVFYLSDNQVWLTEKVPVDYLSILDED